MRAPRWATIGAAIPLVVAGSAFAGELDPVDERAALAHLDKGVAAFRAGKFAEAVRELTLAHDLAPEKPNPFRWLALTQIQLGDCASALPHIHAFLARVPPEDERVAEMTRWRELCSRTGVLRVDSKPSAATLHLDGAIVGTTPYRSLAMRSGPHRLVAERPGFRTATRDIELAAGSELDVTLSLAPIERSMRERWWFWPAIGAAALVVTGGVIFLATRGDDPTVLPPIHCMETTCAP